MQANLEAEKSASQRSKEACRMHEQHEKELSQARLCPMSCAVHTEGITGNVPQIKQLMSTAHTSLRPSYKGNRPFAWQFITLQNWHECLRASLFACGLWKMRHDLQVTRNM